ncbi:hypothetical protein ABWR50_09745, partial [Enterococcus faecium]|uniref:hypothetical protein n=1 Tax=Enterococcus faecium TaxID=1352 RepID=UPI001BD95E53
TERSSAPYKICQKNCCHSIDSEKSTASFYLVVLTTPILVMIENVQLGQIVNQSRISKRQL